MNEKKTTTPPATLPKEKGLRRETDTTLSWVEREYPQLGAWRALAVEWLKGEPKGLPRRLIALSVFFERHLVQMCLPLDPGVYLARTSFLPDFYRTACPDSGQGIKYNNIIHSFLGFVLLRGFSEPDDAGRPVVSPAFHNPIPRLTKSGLPRLDESVHSPLPYGYIDELRQMLAEGPHFSDWHWAQNAFGGGRVAPDWFEVTEGQIDRNDPDCVWRVRPLAKGKRLEMWSPVRWVALLVKLILPLRTFQVRMLDSGEADTWRYVERNWVFNPNHLLAQGSERRPLQQGVFRRSDPAADGEVVSTVLYINTNKTADIATSGPEKGYVMPWLSSVGPLQLDVFYWLEKLRNWQEKYNTVSRRTSWTELDGRFIDAKSQMQLSGYPDACFLFRMPEERERERPMPIKKDTLNPCWFLLLGTLELRLADRCETHRNGLPIRFLPPLKERKNRQTTLFPLHSLRVSLITALAIEGQVPLPILQKLVGHSRLLMTLYYTKPGATHIREVLLDAAKRLEENKESSILNFLLDTDHDELLQRAICNSMPSLAAAIPQHPAARNAAGWMPMHHGLCLVGGNASEIEENGSVGGCYNGGPVIAYGSTQHPKYGPVPGGNRNCVRCRWFVTEPHYLPALADHFNTLAYHFVEARNAFYTREQELLEVKKQKADAEDVGQPFARMDAYRQAERVRDTAAKTFDGLFSDVIACLRLIDRCKEALETSQGDGTELVAVGTMSDVHSILEETDSELLQLSGVCEGTEIYPDLEPGKAVFRRSQLLDAILLNEGQSPFFILLSEKEQLLAGNSFMHRLAQQMNPENPALGKREVIRLMDAGEKLSQYFGVDLASLLPTTKLSQAIPVRKQNQLGGKA